MKAMPPRTFLYNYRAQFAADVESGIKRQTIRPHRKDNRRPKPGDIARHYTGLRTIEARLLRTSEIVRVRELELFIPEREIWLAGEPLSMQRAVEFARADGFAHRDMMFDFFRDTYGGVEFSGLCIEWQAAE